ncbi:hypothetical protein [Capnocytophaga stomatis]|uniref:hypothetical protein n=1 Tax=Capnocytophaga stomatis TaxID=1848904 RepID=UPI001BB38178|nr:hypothetical protein [Capnocytophaga stomatis]
MKNILLYTLLMLVTTLNAQEIKFEADTKEIKIGEQIKYKISVEASDGELVLFPEGQTFMPLEMIRTSPTDTITKGEKLRLEKEYFLTQFDAGSYTIPRQRIKVNSKDFFTDSLLIEVRSVAVDTLKQPLYDIKPIVEVSSNKNMNLWLWVASFLALIALGLLIVYLVLFRKKRLSEAERIENLPPFERAIEKLKKLQNSKYLIESKHKEYYSELTDIIRKYLEDEVHISAKESTSDELLEKIHLLQENGKLNLTLETISNLKRVLKNADLVKFAKSKPEDTIAEYDRETIEDVVVKTKRAIPEVLITNHIPFSEVVKQSKLKTHKKAKKVTFIVLSICFLCFASLLLIMKQSLFDKFHIGNSIENVDTKDWVTSDYGFPITELTTPTVLKRKLFAPNQEMNGIIDKQYIFTTEDQFDDLFIMTSITVFKNDQTNSDEPLKLNPDNIIDIFLSEMEQAGASNITTFDEEYTSAEGAKALKVFGKMLMTDKKTGKSFNAKYELYNFTENNALQQLFISYADKSNMPEIAQKIVNSIKFKIE